MHYELNKWRGALFCLCFALAAAGCSMSDDLDCPPEGGLANSGKTYIRLSFAMPGSGSTRATGGELGDGQEAGQDEENKISSAVAFLYKADETDDKGVNADGETRIAAVVEFNDLTGPDDGADRPDSEHYIDKVYTKTQEVPGIVEYGKYNVIVAANLKENLPSGESEWWNSPQLKLDEVRDHILTKAWNEPQNGESTTYSNFLMTNEADAEITLSEENTSANPAETTVDVERVAARVDYKTNDENNYICTDKTYADGTVKILGATIVNDYTAGSFLLKRVADDVDGKNLEYLGDETPTPSGVATNYVIDPLTSQKNEANKDENFTISQNGKNFQTRADMYAEGTHSSAWSGDPNWWEGKITEGTPMTDEGDGWTRIGYTLENTTPSGTDFAGAKEYNTGVVFQAQFTPADNTVNSKYSKYNYQKEQTFFEYQGKLYSTMEDLEKTYLPNLTSYDFFENMDNYSTWKYIEILLQSLPDKDPAGYKKFLLEKYNEGKDAELTSDLKVSLSWTAYMRDVCGYTFDADNGGVKLDWAGGGKKPEGASSTREILYDNGVRTYENSICYYTWWLLHSNDLTDDTSADNNVEGVMEHAVVRNNIYKLKVTKINSLGDDVPGSASLRVRATVKDWVLLPKEDIIFGPSQGGDAGN